MSRQPRHRGRRDGQGRQEDEARLREEPPEGGDGGGADEHRHGEGLDHPQHHVLEGVDVVDDARHQVATPEAGQAGRSQGLESLEDPHAQVGQGAQGRVVTDETLAVAQETTGQPEELDPDDGECERCLGRVLRGA